MCSRAAGTFHSRRASGVLHFERARMSEDTAQGQESELQNAREVIIFFQTRIHTDLHRFELEEGENRELVRGRHISKLSPNTSNLNSTHEIKQSDA